jgi:hypothetical protein
MQITISYPITGLDRPLGLQKVQASRISRQSAYEGAYTLAAFTSQEILLVLISFRD